MVDLDFEKGKGLLPAIVQEFRTGKVLMLAYVNRASWEKTLETGEAHYWSRSRQEIWHKGGTSAMCRKSKKSMWTATTTRFFSKWSRWRCRLHTGYETCFHKQVGRDREITIVGERIFDPEHVYKK